MKGSLILIIIVLAVVGFFGYSYIQQPQTASNVGESIEGAAAKTAGFVQTQAKVVTERTQDLTQSAKTGANKIADKTAQAVTATQREASKLAEKTAKAVDTSKVKETVVKAEDKIGEVFERAGSKLEKDGEKMQEQAKIDTPDLEKGAEDLAEKIKALISKAQAQLEKGDLKEATQTAEDALKLDPKSAEAKNILTSAKEKLAAMAKEKAGEFATGLSDKAVDAESALGSLGQ